MAQTKDPTTPPPYHEIVGMDPAARWILGPGRAEFLREAEGFIPFALTLDEEAAREAFAKLMRAEDAIRPRLFDRRLRTEGAAPPAGRTVAAYARESFFRALALAHPDTPALETLKRARKRIRFSAPLPARAFAGDPDAELSRPPVSPLDGVEHPVILAVIDDGLPVFNARFREARTLSRVHYFWQMGGPAVAANPTVAAGREWWKASGLGRPGLDELLAEAAAKAPPDAEDWLYRAAGMATAADDSLGTLSLRRSHGAHVLDMMAGEPMEAGVRDRPIIAVQLPEGVVADSSGAQLESQIVAAIHYIRDRALLLSAGRPKPIPVVLNISYGFTAGAHDGRRQVEELFEQVTAATDLPMTITLAAGNAHLSRCHAVAPAPKPTPPASAASTLRMRALPDDLTPSSVEIWTPPGPSAGAPPRLRVRLTDPNGRTEGWLDERDGTERILRRPDAPPGADGQRPEIAELKWAADPVTGRGAFHVRLQPTARHPSAENALTVAPAGVWTVEIERLPPSAADAFPPIGPENPVELWVQRDDAIPGHGGGGRQVRFEHPGHPDLTWAEFAHAAAAKLRTIPDGTVADEVPVRRENLLNAIATGRGAIVVGAFHRREWRPAPFSSGGREAGLFRRRPDLMADAATSLAHAGLLASGCRSGSYVAMTGTSVAAPRVARWIAQAGGDVSRVEMRALAFLSELFVVPADAAAPDPLRLGLGRIRFDWEAQPVPRL